MHWPKAAAAIAAVTALLAGAKAAAAPAPAAPAASTGSYSVSYPPCNGCLTDWLEERSGNGNWQSVGRGTVSFAGKPYGTYQYRTVYFYMQDPYGWYTWSDYSAAVTVTVAGNVPGADPLESQLRYQYETRAGDANGDGRADLFVNRTAGGASGNGAVERLLLLQAAGGQFSAAVPSDAQTAWAKTWPQAGVQIVLRDFNVDGFVDLLLKNVAGALGVGGALNQIVYAPAQPLSLQPKGVRAVDSSLKQFAANAHDYLADTSYFVQNAPVSITVYQVAYSYCYPGAVGYGGYDYPGAGFGGECGWFTYYLPVAVPDYSSFSGGAVSAWNTEAAIQNRSVTVEQGVQSIKQAFEQMLGVPIGGRDLGGVRGERGTFDDPTYRHGYELFQAVLGIFEANAQELTPPREATRRTDVVYVTGRHILGFLPIHTAVEYSGSTLSANDSNPALLTDGILVSHANHPSDAPPLMMTLGTVASAWAAPLYWAQLVAADSHYPDNLPYDAIPSVGAGGYNSNGYAHGLIRATGGVPSIDMTRFVGGEKPVPAAYFR
jgi:hypothetical protein